LVFRDPLAAAEPPYDRAIEPTGLPIVEVLEARRAIAQSCELEPARKPATLPLAPLAVHEQTDALVEGEVAMIVASIDLLA
jgi:hypothetical protein